MPEPFLPRMKGPIPPSLRDLLTPIVEKHTSAADAVSRAIAKVKALPAAKRNSILREAMHYTISNAVYDLRHDLLRSTVKYQPNPEPAVRNVPGLRARIHVAGYLTYFTTPYGPLGECTGTQLDDLIGLSDSLALGHKRNAAFFAALRKRVEDDQRVKEVWTDKKAKSLWTTIAESDI